MAKKNSVKVQLVSEAGTGTTYHVYVNFRTAKSKLRVRKYDKVTRKHEWFIEKKLPGAKIQK